MKVAFFLGGLIRGGMESLVLDVFRNQNLVPFEMVCVYRKEGNFSDSFHSTGVTMLQLNRIGSLVQYIVALRKLFLEEKIDIVHAQTASNALLCSIALLGTNIKLVTTMHGFSFLNAPFWQQKSVFGRSNQVVFVSKCQQQLYAQKLQNKGINQCPVVYNGIAVEKFEKQYKRPEFLQTGFLSLVMVGSFSAARSQKVIIQAIHKLKKEGIWNGVRFYFVGGAFRDEEYRMKECEEMVRTLGLDDDILFVGVRNDVPAILQYIDGYVYSSAADTFGIAVVEAMMAGVPVVVNDFDVMCEITHDGEWASLYKTYDAKDCAEKIYELISNVGEYKKRAQTNAIKVKKRYSIKTHIENLYKVYQTL